MSGIICKLTSRGGLARFENSSKRQKQRRLKAPDLNSCRHCSLFKSIEPFDYCAPFKSLTDRTQLKIQTFKSLRCAHRSGQSFNAGTTRLWSRVFPAAQPLAVVSWPLINFSVCELSVFSYSRVSGHFQGNAEGQRTLADTQDRTRLFEVVG